MARVNIEEHWWSDPRRMKLILKIGMLADAVAVNMWRVAQEFWGRDCGLVPIKVFESLECASELLGCGLAEVRGDAVYVRGSSQHLSWIHESREQAREKGRKGGVKSATRPRDAKGRLLSSKQDPSKPKQDPSKHPSGVQANPSQSKPSVSDSGSGSKNEEDRSSSPLVEETLSPEPVSPLSAIGPKPEHNPTADFEARFKFDLPGLFALYPRPQKKSQAMHILSKAIRSREDYAAWERAIRNYAEHCRRERAEMKFILTFPNFAEEWTDWRDYSHKNAAPLNAPGSVRYEAAADVLARQETEREHVSENRAEAAKRVRELLAKAGKFGVARGSA